VSEGLKPLTIFYCTYTQSFAEPNHNLDMEGETLQWYLTKEDAERSTVEMVDGHGMTTYIFECKPILKVARGKTKSIPVKAKP
jgi:hypothetical protein